MKVKEYLVNRILELERELKQVQNEKAGTTYGLQKLQEEVIKLNERIEQYEMEREHIKQIITCNIVEDSYHSGKYFLDLMDGENDFMTLMSILNIKQEDYESVIVHPECEKSCVECKYADFTNEKCTYEDQSQKELVHECSRYTKKEVTEDAETTD